MERTVSVCFSPGRATSRYNTLAYVATCLDASTAMSRRAVLTYVQRAAMLPGCVLASRDRAGVIGRGRRTSDQCDQCSLARRVTRAAYEYLRL